MGMTRRSLMAATEGPNAEPSRRARFWAFVNLDWVKITLAPGDQLTHVTGGQHEEGYSFTTETWAFNGQTVTREIDTTGRDCDGRHYEHDVCDCDITDLAFYPSLFYPKESADSPERTRPPAPKWERIGRHSRDFSAEAAGY